MSIASAKKIEAISRSADPKQAILEAVGDLTKIDVFSDLVLLGTYIRNEKTVGGIILPTDNLREDEYQGKVGLVLKTGPYAYGDWEDEDRRGENAKPGTWVAYQVKDRWPFQIDGAPVCLVPYERLRVRIPDPTLVF